MSEKKCYVIVVNYNGWKDTIECLESLYRSDYTNFQTIIVDNYSTDESVLHIKKWALGAKSISIESDFFNARLENSLISKPLNFEILDDNFIIQEKNNIVSERKLTLINSNENKGYAAGNNLGFKYALSQDDCDYLWILNNDTFIDENSLGNQIKYIKSKDKLVLLGSKLLYYDNPGTIQSYGGQINSFTMVTNHIGDGRKNDEYFSRESIPDYIPGASIFCDKKIIEKIGNIPEEYFMYGEDLDWSLKARAHGIELHICPDSIIWHKEGASLKYYKKGNRKPELSDHLSVVNRLIVAKKYFPKRILFVYAGILVSILRRLFRRQPKRSMKIAKHILNHD